MHLLKNYCNNLPHVLEFVLFFPFFALSLHDYLSCASHRMENEGS